MSGMFMVFTWFSTDTFVSLAVCLRVDDRRWTFGKAPISAMEFLKAKQESSWRRRTTESLPDFTK